MMLTSPPLPAALSTCPSQVPAWEGAALPTWDRLQRRVDLMKRQHAETDALRGEIARANGLHCHGPGLSLRSALCSLSRSPARAAPRQAAQTAGCAAASGGEPRRALGSEEEPPLRRAAEEEGRGRGLPPPGCRGRRAREPSGRPRLATTARQPGQTRAAGRPPPGTLAGSTTTRGSSHPGPCPLLPATMPRRPCPARPAAGPSAMRRASLLKAALSVRAEPSWSPTLSRQAGRLPPWAAPRDLLAQRGGGSGKGSDAGASTAESAATRNDMDPLLPRPPSSMR